MIPSEISNGFLRLAEEAAKYGMVIKSVSFDTGFYHSLGSKTDVSFTAVRYDAKFDPSVLPKPVQS